MIQRNENRESNVFRSTKSLLSQASSTSKTNKDGKMLITNKEEEENEDEKNNNFRVEEDEEEDECKKNVKKIVFGITRSSSFAFGTAKVNTVFKINSREEIITTTREIIRVDSGIIINRAPHKSYTGVYCPSFDALITVTELNPIFSVFLLNFDIREPVCTDIKLDQVAIYHIFFDDITGTIITFGNGIKTWNFDCLRKCDRHVICENTARINLRASFAPDYTAFKMQIPSLDAVNRRIVVPTSDGLMCYDYDGNSIESPLKKHHNHWFTLFAFNPFSQKMLTSDRDEAKEAKAARSAAFKKPLVAQGIQIWRRNGTLSKELSFTNNSLFAAFFVNQEFVVAIDSSFSVHILDLKTSKFFTIFKLEFRPSQIYFQNDERDTRLVVCQDGNIFYYDICIPWRLWVRTQIAPIKIDRCPKLDQAARICAQFVDSSVRLFTPYSTLLTLCHSKSPSTPTCVFVDRGVPYRENRDQIFVILENGTVEVYASNEVPCLPTSTMDLKAHCCCVSDMLGTLCVLFGTKIGDVLMYDYRTLTFLKRIMVAQGEILFLFPHFKSNTLLVLIDFKMYRISLENAGLIEEYRQTCSKVAALFDDLFIVGYENGSFLIEKIMRSGIEIIYNEPHPQHQGKVVGLSKGSNYFVSGGFDGSVLIWNMNAEVLVSLMFPLNVYSVGVHNGLRGLLVGTDSDIMFVDGKSLFGEDVDKEDIPFDNYDRRRDYILENLALLREKEEEERVLKGLSKDVKTKGGRKGKGNGKSDSPEKKKQSRYAAMMMKMKKEKEEKERLERKKREEEEAKKKRRLEEEEEENEKKKKDRDEEEEGNEYEIDENGNRIKKKKKRKRRGSNGESSEYYDDDDEDQIKSKNKNNDIFEDEEQIEQQKKIEEEEERRKQQEKEEEEKKKKKKKEMHIVAGKEVVKIDGDGKEGKPIDEELMKRIIAEEEEEEKKKKEKEEKKNKKEEKEKKVREEAEKREKDRKRKESAETNKKKNEVKPPSQKASDSSPNKPNGGGPSTKDTNPNAISRKDKEKKAITRPDGTESSNPRNKKKKNNNKQDPNATLSTQLIDGVNLDKAGGKGKNKIGSGKSGKNGKSGKKNNDKDEWPPNNDGKHTHARGGPNSYLDANGNPVYPPPGSKFYSDGGPNGGPPGYYDENGNYLGPASNFPPPGSKYYADGGPNGGPPGYYDENGNFLGPVTGPGGASAGFPPPGSKFYADGGPNGGPPGYYDANGNYLGPANNFPPPGSKFYADGGPNGGPPGYYDANGNFLGPIKGNSTGYPPPGSKFYSDGGPNGGPPGYYDENGNYLGPASNFPPPGSKYYADGGPNGGPPGYYDENGNFLGPVKSGSSNYPPPGSVFYADGGPNGGPPGYYDQNGNYIGPASNFPPPGSKYYADGGPNGGPPGYYDENGNFLGPVNNSYNRATSPLDRQSACSQLNSNKGRNNDHDSSGVWSPSRYKRSKTPRMDQLYRLGHIIHVHIKVDRDFPPDIDIRKTRNPPCLVYSPTYLALALGDGKCNESAWKKFKTMVCFTGVNDFELESFTRSKNFIFKNAERIASSSVPSSTSPQPQSSAATTMKASTKSNKSNKSKQNNDDNKVDSEFDDACVMKSSVPIIELFQSSEAEASSFTRTINPPTSSRQDMHSSRRNTTTVTPIETATTSSRSNYNGNENRPTNEVVDSGSPRSNLPSLNLSDLRSPLGEFDEAGMIGGSARQPSFSARSNRSFASINGSLASRRHCERPYSVYPWLDDERLRPNSARREQTPVKILNPMTGKSVNKNFMRNLVSIFKKVHGKS